MARERTWTPHTFVATGNTLEQVTDVCPQSAPSRPSALPTSTTTTTALSVSPSSRRRTARPARTVSRSVSISACQLTEVGADMSCSKSSTLPTAQPHAPPPSSSDSSDKSTHNSGQASRLCSGGADDTILLYKALSPLHHELYYFPFFFLILEMVFMSAKKRVA